MLKYLRIALTALCLTACVLLVALWVRSYSVLEAWRGHVIGNWSVHSQSANGKLVVFALDDRVTEYDAIIGIKVSGYSKVPLMHVPLMYKRSIALRAAIAGNQTTTVIRWHSARICEMPFWVPVLVTAALATVPWFHWSKRFSLRTLLIATTLVAVVLGIIAASR